MKEKIIEWLRLPEAKVIGDLDDPAATIIHSRIIREKQFLHQVYLDYYRNFENALGKLSGTETIVELGSGGGFIKEVIPSVITSDILQIPSVDVCFCAQHMPVNDGSVDAYLMIDVFHHIKNPKDFLNELCRTLKPGGKILMIEPANTFWGRFIWGNFHHEQFDPTSGWAITGEGPMSNANGALPWIVFCRDRDIFEKDYKDLKIVSLKPCTPFKYLISGGLSIRQLLPSFCYPLIVAVEWLVTPLNRWLGMFYFIELVKNKGKLT